MPCRSSHEEFTKFDSPIVQNGVNPEYHSAQMQILRKNISDLEATICALITEIEKEGLIDRIIYNASVNGRINLFKFWENHRREDNAKLLKLFEGLSDHEKQLLKKTPLTNEQKN